MRRSRREAREVGEALLGGRGSGRGQSPGGLRLISGAPSSAVSNESF